MSDKSKIISALVIGAIAGAAIVKLLETDTAKEIVETIKNKTDSATDNIKSKIAKLESELNDLLQFEKENNLNNQA